MTAAPHARELGSGNDGIQPTETSSTSDTARTQFAQANLSDVKAAGTSRGQTPEALGFAAVKVSDGPGLNLSIEQFHLSRAMDKMPPAQRQAMKADMEAFEKRVQTEHLPPETVARTYHEMNRILQASGSAIGQKERAQIAADVLHQAAEPVINQGGSNTCALAVLEARAYTHHPDQAAKLVADVVSSGQFQTERGPVPIDKESIAQRFGTGLLLVEPRSHASQIFQITAANIYLQERSTEEGKDLRYSQSAPHLEETHELVMDHSKSPPVEESRNTFGVPIGQFDKLDRVYAAITGDNSKGVYIDASQNLSRDQFRQQLQEAARSGKLPATVGLDLIGQTGSVDRPFFHAVEITGFDKTTGMVSVRNPMHASRLEQIPVDSLYDQMHFPRLDDVQRKAFVDAFLKNADPKELTAQNLKDALQHLLPEEREAVINTRGSNGTRIRDLLGSQQLRELGISSSWWPFS